MGDAAGGPRGLGGALLRVYGIASILPGRSEARWFVLAATVPALAADALLLWKTLGGGSQADALDRWTTHVGATGVAISLIEVIWQAAPGLLI